MHLPLHPPPQSGTRVATGLDIYLSTGTVLPTLVAGDSPVGGGVDQLAVSPPVGSRPWARAVVEAALGSPGLLLGVVLGVTVREQPCPDGGAPLGGGGGRI